MEEKLHLLFDSGFIKSYGNMEPVLGKPEKAAQNPLFRNDSRKETGFIPQNDPWKYQIYCIFCSSAARRRLVQKISIACSSSSTGGREGAMRMLESCGSRP